jgi:SPASM domain peptide maturase of grasp-with-spasm system
MSYIYLLPSCTITDGQRRSLLHDTQNNRNRLLSREVAAALKLYSGKQTEEFRSHLQNLGIKREALDRLLDILVEEGFLLLSAVPIPFAALPVEFDQPFAITNAIIDIANTNRDLLQKMISSFQSIFCPHLQLRLYKDIIPDALLINALAAFAATDTLNTIELIMPFFEGFEALPEQLGNTAQLSLILYNAPTNDVRQIKHMSQAVLITEALDFPSCCGIVDMAYFNFSIQHYTEAMQRNSCLNRKISIDQYGYIKNCPSMANHFGHVNDIALSEVLKNNTFYEVSGITKDHVSVCNNCEFRYVCTDCRAYLEKPDDLNSKPLKCGYNPYTCTWEEWATIPAKQAAMSYYGL